MSALPEITVRRAGRADFWPLFRVLVEMHKDNALYPLSHQKALKWVAGLIDNKDAWVFLAEREGEILGTIAAEIDAPAYSDCCYLAEQWIFVRPQYRQTRAIFKLMRALKSLEQETGLKAAISIVSPTEPGRKVAFFKRYFSEVRYGLLQLQ